MEIGIAFIASQVLVLIAMVSDFLSFQFKKKKYTYICFGISVFLIATHFILLGKYFAGFMSYIGIIRFYVSYRTSSKKVMSAFLILYSVLLFFIYSAPIDIIYYIALVFVTIGNFNESNKKMREYMMCGTMLVILFEVLILTPMGIILDSIFLLSNFLGYYRFYVRPDKKKRISSVEYLLKLWWIKKILPSEKEKTLTTE